MTDLWRTLCHLDFPDNTKEALKYVRHWAAEKLCGVTSVHGGDDESYVADIVHEFVIFSGTRKSSKRLTAMQELNLMEILCDFLQELGDTLSYTAFRMLFAGRPEAIKTALLTKLISMVISVKSPKILDCCAYWMQEQGFLSRAVLDLCRALIEDYCSLFSEKESVFHQLPTVSPLFACNLLEAMTVLYSCEESNKIPCQAVVSHVVDWINQHPLLCFASKLHEMQQSATKREIFHYQAGSPIGGLINWSVVAPIIIADQEERFKSFGSFSSGQKSTANSSNSEACLMLSQLHLSLLQTMLANSQKLDVLMLYEMDTVVQNILQACANLPHSFVEEFRHQATERLAQILQVALVSRSFRCSKGDLRSTLRKLLPNRLLEMIFLNMESENIKSMDVG